MDTALELGKFTYPKMLHILYVVLYSVALLFSVSYKNRGLGLPEVVVCTMRIKTMVDLKIGSFFTHGVGQYLIGCPLHTLVGQYRWWWEEAEGEPLYSP